MEKFRKQLGVGKSPANYNLGISVEVFTWNFLLPRSILAATNAQSANWLLTTATLVCFKYFWVMLAVSTAARRHVSALHELGSSIILLKRGAGYAICWCKSIMEVLCVICARVRLGSMLTRDESREMSESFHFWGRNIFQLVIVRYLQNRQPWHFTYCTSLRSSSLNRVSQLAISLLLLRFTRCRKKNMVT